MFTNCVNINNILSEEEFLLRNDSQTNAALAREFVCDKMFGQNPVLGELIIFGALPFSLLLQVSSGMKGWGLPELSLF